MPGKYAKDLLGGRGTLSFGDEAWITAAEDLEGITTTRAIAQRLTLWDKTGNLRLDYDAVVEFRLKELNGIASPINRTNSGFLVGGLTRGGAREWVIPSNLPIDIVNIRYLE